MLLLMTKHLVFLLSFFIFGNGNAQPPAKKMSREEYFEKYRVVAVQDMMQTGVPASITLAQGAFESDNGNSPLALEANNHFGIKCHDWQGKKYFYDDDEKQECFRSYESPIESFNDHSYFLKNRERYAFLFDIPRSDYKAWAYGLKKAGYATNPIYAEKIIKIIEDNKLYELDQMNSVASIDQRNKVSLNPARGSSEKKAISIGARNILFINGVKYVTAQKGDSYDKICKDFNMRPWQIYKYNDLPKTASIAEGQKIYLQPKRRKPKEEFHTVQTGETMYMISQRYAVKLKLLYRRNRMEKGQPVKPGQRLWLRYKKKKSE